FHLTVADPPLGPSVQATPSNGIACIGDTLQFSASVSGTPPFTYQWRKNGANLSGATSAALSIVTTSVNDSGSYDVVITNGCGPAASTPISVAVLAPPSITADPKPTAACVSGLGAAKFTVGVSGSEPLAYQWRRNGNAISGATSSVLTISPVTSNDGG